MQKFAWCGVVALGVILVGGNPAAAAGVGVYLQYSGMEGHVDLPSLSSNEVHYTTDRAGIGFTYDASLKEDVLFSYRFDAGYAHGWQSMQGEDVETNGFSTNQYFTFGVLRNDRVRLWLAPVVGLSVDFPDTDLPSGTPWSLTVGGGAAVGTNVHLNDHLSLSFAAGYQRRWRHNEIDWDRSGPGWEGNGWGNYWFANMGFLFNTAR